MQEVSRFWLPTLNLYIVAGDCNSKEAARELATTNDRRARVFYTTEEPKADAVTKGILFAPDGSEQTVTIYPAGHGENSTVHFTP